MRSTKFISLFLLCALITSGLSSCVQPPEERPSGSTSDTNETTEIISLPAVSENETEPTKDMQLEDGYSVTSETSFDFSFTENKEKKPCTARLATLKNSEGEHALYLDIMENGEIVHSKHWYGRCQAFISENVIIIFRVNINSDKRGMAAIEFYEVSDIKLTSGQPGYAYTEEHLESPEIVKVPDSGASINLALQTEAAIATMKAQFKNFISQVEQVFYKPEKSQYLIADSFSDPEKDQTFHPSEKIATPDFEDKTVTDRYTIEYFMSLFTY